MPLVAPVSTQSVEELDPKLQKFVEILTEAKKLNSSDIHLAPASPVMLRVDGALIPLEGMAFKPFEIDELLEVMLDETQLEELEEMGEIDFAYSVPGFSRLRLNVFRQRGTYAMALRILSFEVPDAEKIGLPQSVIDLADKKRGLVLVTGATGSGKSTTLAALISKIAKTYAKTIITLEDPIEYLHKHGKGIVSAVYGYIHAVLCPDPVCINQAEILDLSDLPAAIAVKGYSLHIGICSCANAPEA